METRKEFGEIELFRETMLGVWFLKKVAQFKAYFARRGYLLTLNTLLVVTFLSAFGVMYWVTSEKVYHLYVDGENIGYISDQSLVDDWQEACYSEIRDLYPDWQLTLNSKLVVKPGRKSLVHFNDEGVIAKIRENVTYDTVGVAILVDGKPVGVVHNKEIAIRVVDELKAEYRPSKQDYEIASLDAAGQKIEIINSIEFKETINYQNVQTSPDTILSEEEMFAYLKKGDVEESTYKVKSGDSIPALAAKFELTPSELRQMNPQVVNDFLKVGDVLNVTAYKPPITIHVAEELTQVERIPYPIDYTKDTSLFVNESRTIRYGVDGEKIVDYDIVKENGIVVDRIITNVEITREPVRALIAKGTKPVPTRGSGILAWPVNGGYITSGFGTRWGKTHTGIDIAGTTNRTIKAADNGIITYAGWYGTYGNCVIIDHGGGMSTLYGHMSSLNVSKGNPIAKGQQIGVMGNTGNSYGIHLHFEVRIDGVRKNPINYVGI